MSKFSDIYDAESIRPIKPTPLSNAKSYWLSKFGSQQQDFQIALAPHTIRLMECCSIAIDKYCVVIGNAQKTVPRSSSSHRILDLQNHPSYNKTIDIIRDFLKVLNLKQTYTFRVEQPLGPNGKIAIETVLVGIWKFITLFQTELSDVENIQEVFAAFFESQKLNISRSEIKAVLNGGERNGYFNGPNESIMERRLYGKETEVLSENVSHFFNEFDFIYVRTNMSELNPSSDRCYRKSLIDRLMQGFRDCIYDEEDNMDIEYESNQYNFDFNSVPTILSNYSKARMETTPFHGCSYEIDYQHVLHGLTEKYPQHKKIKGGCVTNEGIILVAHKSEQVLKSPAFHIMLAEGFLDMGRIPTFITLEKLIGGFGARPVQSADYHIEQNKEPTIIKLVPKSQIDDEGLHASSSSSSKCQEHDQHFVLDNSDIVESDDDDAEIY